MRQTILAVLGLIMVWWPGAVLAQGTDPAADVLQQILDGEPVPAELFDQSFLDIVPIDQLNTIVAQTLNLTGAPEHIDQSSPGIYRVRSDGYDMTVQITLNGAGKVVGLFFQTPLAIDISVEDLLAQFNGMGRDVAWLITRNGEVLYEHDAATPLAVGSAFKLGVLAEIAERIAAGDLAWDSVAHLEPRDLSLPSGMLQTFPVGAPLTVHTAAALMISISDNTAADLLLDLAGREAVAERLGADFIIKTRELFFLKRVPALRERFLAADTAGKYALAAEIDALDIKTISGGGNDPLTDGVEWYVPLTTLCTVMAEVADLDVMHISPGPANPSDWAAIAYKGGSEVGVLNLTTQVTSADGDTYCVAMTVNDTKALNETVLGTTYAAILAALSRQ